MPVAEWQRRDAQPFTSESERGNSAAVKSGAWSPALVAETVEELRPALQRIVDQAPWIRPIDVDALEDYLYDRARLTRLERWLAEHGDRYPSGKRAGELRERDLRELGTLRRRCMDHRRALGLDPSSRARMRFDRAAPIDMAQLLSGMTGDEEEEASDG